MKKITLLLLFCCALFAHQAKAQFSALTIKNGTGCDIYYTLYGAKAPSCGITSKSAVIMISAGATVTFANPVVAGMPGLAPTDYIVGAGVYNKNPVMCAGIVAEQHNVFHPCAGSPQDEQTKIFDNSCTYCNTTDIQWSIGGSSQTLYLY